MTKKVLIVIGDIGSGHRSAAIAITDQYKMIDDSIEVQTIDIFTYKLKNKPQRSIQEILARTFAGSQANDVAYEFMSKNQAFNFLYDSTWHLSNTNWGSSITGNIIINGYKYEMEEVLNEYKPDVVISIHPLMNSLARHFKHKYNYKYFTIITDLVTLHSGWIEKDCDLIFSPSIEATQMLILEGINPKKIIGPLFPVKPQFENIKDRDAQLAELNLSKNKTTLLMAGGGSGIYSALKHIRRLLRTDKYQIIIVTGKATKLKTKLEKKYKKNNNIAILGYVNNMQDIMNVADIVISKTGPGTIIELEVLNKKAVFTKYVGAQEEGNIYYISSNPLFRYVGDRRDLIDEKIEELANLDLKIEPKRSVKETERIVKTIIKNS
jgi:UDP-N-acetylglucosamine:LPS N-acetylglucosamine transferase